MSDILGFDIDGRPLRAGDEVVLIQADDDWCRQFLGKAVRLIGPLDNLEIETDGEDGDYYLSVEGPDVRKLHDDHLPAPESFEQIMQGLRGVPV